MNKLFDTFHQAERNFFSMVSLKQLDCKNMSAFAIGVPTSSLNLLIVHDTNELFSSNLNTCEQFYTQQKLPWSLVLPEYLYSKELDQLLQDHGLKLDDKGTTMEIELTQVKAETQNPFITIKEMNHDLETWSIPLLHGFKSTPEMICNYTERHQLATKKSNDLYHFSGFVNDKAVTSLTLSLSGKYARLDDIATIPEYQKQGYASLLIHKALEHAAQLNATTCFLEASMSGLSVYKRMGFQELFMNYYYEQASI